MSDGQQPIVSIGLSVFNGSNYIELAIASILGQTLNSFELIITDNASTDETEAICRRYTERDGRVHYRRNASNIGAGANFNRCFALASAKYFKWAAPTTTSWRPPTSSAAWPRSRPIPLPCSASRWSA